MWKETDNKLVREFKFASFAEIVAFTVHIGFICEKLKVYPKMMITENKIVIELEGGTALALNQRLKESINQILQ